MRCDGSTRTSGVRRTPHVNSGSAPGPRYVNWREEAPTTPDEDRTRDGGVGEKREEGKGNVSAGNVERKGEGEACGAGGGAAAGPRATHLQVTAEAPPPPARAATRCAVTTACRLGIVRRDGSTANLGRDDSTSNSAGAPGRQHGNLGRCAGTTSRKLE